MLARPLSHVTDVHQQSFKVAYDYTVAFTHDAFGPGNRCPIDVLARHGPDKRHRGEVFIDESVLAAMTNLPRRATECATVHARNVEIVGAPITVDSGENCKNDPATTPRLLAIPSKYAIDRRSFAIGGSVVLDAVGYASAIFHGGVRHIRLPMTVLAQDDSGVDIKNAVNALGLKNLIGTFATPRAVINGSAFIDVLPPRKKRAGIAEALKVALIGNQNFFCRLEDNAALASFSAPLLERLIKNSAQLHMRQIRLGGDPFEGASARPLDFGHCSAHKLERLTRHALSRSEAVAIGVALDTPYSVATGLLEAGEDERVARLLKTLGFTLWHDQLEHRNAPDRDPTGLGRFPRTSRQRTDRNAPVIAREIAFCAKELTE